MATTDQACRGANIPRVDFVDEHSIADRDGDVVAAATAGLSETGDPAADWRDLVGEAGRLGYQVELVEYCESAESPGLLGAGLGVCIYDRCVIRVRRALNLADRVWVLRHEIGHARIGHNVEINRRYDARWHTDPVVLERHRTIGDYLYPHV